MCRMLLCYGEIERLQRWRCRTGERRPARTGRPDWGNHRAEGHRVAFPPTPQAIRRSDEQYLTSKPASFMRFRTPASTAAALRKLARGRRSRNALEHDFELDTSPHAAEAPATMHATFASVLAISSFQPPLSHHQCSEPSSQLQTSYTGRKFRPLIRDGVLPNGISDDPIRLSPLSC